MPLYYKGIHPEVAVVRNRLGLFDVSHMGRISITGSDVIPFLEHLSTNTVHDKPFGKAFYTIFCNEMGYCMDDLLVYLIHAESAFIIVNAANRKSDLNHLKVQSKKFHVAIEDHFDEGILAVQGPYCRDMFRHLVNLEPFQFAAFEAGVYVSRTGYTGEEGYEFYGPQAFIVRFWEHLLQLGKQFGIEPCGLGARDILRLEMGYALYSHETSDKIYPLESVAKWAVDLKAHDFLGKQALIAAKEAHAFRHPIALKGLEKIPAREGYLLYFHGTEIGVVTSGAFSPTLSAPIALGLVQENIPLGTVVDVSIRSDYHPFQVVKLPFYKRLA